MSDHRAEFAVQRMCRTLGVSTSGYYAWCQREPSTRSCADETLERRIMEIHQGSRGTYGVPRIHAELAADGVAVGRKRVSRLMRRAGIQGISRRGRAWTTRRDRDARPAPDLVERDFGAPGPDQLWVADITYVPTWAGFLYLRYVGFAPLSASLAAAMPPAARPDCAMQPVRSVLRVAHMNFAKTTAVARGH